MNDDNIKEKITGSALISMPSTNAQSVDLYEDQQPSGNKNHALPHASTDVPSEMNKYTCKGPNHNLVESDRATNISWHRKEAAGDGIITRQLEYVVIFPSLPMLIIFFIKHLCCQLTGVTEVLQCFHSWGPCNPP